MKHVCGHVAVALCVVLTGLISPADIIYGKVDEKKYMPLPPVDSFFFPRFYVKVKAPPKSTFPSYVPNSSTATYVMYGRSYAIHIYHQATLSSKTMADFISENFSDVKLKELGVDATRVKKSVNDDSALLEIEEIILSNSKMHLYQKLVKTTEGYAVVAGQAECRDWPKVGQELIAIVSSSRRMREDELRILGEGRFVVGMDSDGDVFDGSANCDGVIDADGKPVRSGGRNYFLRPAKNKPVLAEESNQDMLQDANEGKEPKPDPDGRIHKLFGMEIGELLVDYDNAKKLNNKSYRVRETMNLSAPFSICKNVSKFYTANNRRLYKITLSSDAYLNPNEAKMRSRMAEMSKAIGEKFKDELEMEASGSRHIAKFKGDAMQSLSLAIVAELDNKKALLITFVDKTVELDVKGVR